MMVEKEAGVYEGAHFKSIWKPFKAPNGEFRHVFANLSLSSVYPCF